MADLPLPGHAQDRHGHTDDGASHGRGGHSHAVRADTDRRWLSAGLAAIVAFMAVEVVVGFAANSLALLSDAAHMLTDAASIILAILAASLAARPARGRYTYGLKRAEILAAQLNGTTLLLLGGWLAYHAVRRLLEPPAVAGGAVVATALAGVVVNIGVAAAISRANRSSLNVEGAFQHILTDLYAFLATAVAGLIVLVTGFARADAIASLVVVVLIAVAGIRLLRDSGRVLLEAAPSGLDPDVLADQMLRHDDVVEIHDLHVWEITSNQPALSAHVLVAPGTDCHRVRMGLERELTASKINHTTLQVDHVNERTGSGGVHCTESHGTVHRASSPSAAPGAPEGPDRNARP